MQANEGREVEAVFLRHGSVARLRLTPRQWGGRGLLWLPPAPAVLMLASVSWGSGLCEAPPMACSLLAVDKYVQGTAGNVSLAGTSQSCCLQQHM